MASLKRVACTSITGLCLLGAAAACSHAPRANGEPTPTRDPAVSRPLDIYRDLGLKTGSSAFPAVASIATMAGAADSTYVMLELSLPSNALRFERTPQGFLADYSVSLSFLQDTTTVRRMDDRQHVTVATFAETSRSDESVVYQNGVSVKPGRYVLQMQVGDINSTRGFRSTDTVDIPAYGPNSTRVGSPVFVYSAEGRASRNTRPVLVSNPRHTVAYGGDSPRMYVEAYGLQENEPVKVNVVNDQGASIWSVDATLPKGNDSLRYGVVDLPSEKLPLGRMWVEVSAAGSTARRTPLVLSISDQWMVTNFDEVLDFLRYIAYQDELDSLKAGGPEQRRRAWESFWAKRDPLPVTPANEFRDQFFERVRSANELYKEPGLFGWKTERGEVYIVLGPPDHVQERWVGNIDPQTAPANALEWDYDNAPGGRLSLLFIDVGMFGRYQLEPSSANAFKVLEDRLKPGHNK
jgi:GWxTD domain-containing protein